VAHPASSSEYFGRFSGDPQGQFIETPDRPRFKLTSPFEFEDPNTLKWRVPPDTEVDGASIPKVLWSVIGGPFSGRFLKASIVHDYYCDRKVRTAHDTHRNFYYGMRANGVSENKATLMYWAVKAFGP